MLAACASISLLDNALIECCSLKISLSLSLCQNLVEDYVQGGLDLCGFLLYFFLQLLNVVERKTNRIGCSCNTV